MTKFVPKEVLGDSTFVSVYDPESGDTGYVRMGDLVSMSETTVTATTGPGGGIALSAGSEALADEFVAPTTTARVAALEALAEAAFSVQTEIHYASLQVGLSVTSPGSFARDLPFCGFAERYSPSGVSFNAVRVKSVVRTAALETSRWATLNVVVRTGQNSASAGAPVVAVGSVLVSETDATLSDVMILLRDPATGNAKTLTNADFVGGEYLIGVYARNASNGPASCGEPQGTTTNNLGQSYYTRDTDNAVTGTWLPMGGGSNRRMCVEHLLLETPAEVKVYKGASTTLAESLAALAVPAPEIVLPPTIYAVQGRECNVYIDNLHVHASSEWDHDIVTSGDVGLHQSERWTWTPSGAVTTGTLTIKAHHPRSGIQVASKVADIRAAGSSAQSGTTKKVLVIGDSLVNADVITQTLLDIAAGGDVMGVTLLGTQGTAPNRHEGRSGWTVNKYTTDTVGNPFWFSGAVNFAQYLTDNTIAVPDWVFIQLGINDVFGQTNDDACSAAADAAFIELDTLINSIKDAGASTKVGLMIPPPPSSQQDAFSASYGVGQTRWRNKRNILIWARQLVEKYAGQEASRVYIVPSNTALDTVNNVSVAAAAPANSRSTVNVVRQNNGVHPASSGYQQIGDALWAVLKYVG